MQQQTDAGLIKPHQKQALSRVILEYTRESKNLIPLLQKAQDIIGYLPDEAIKQIADHLRLSYTQVIGVITFYAQFYLQPRGKNVIRPCMGTACHVRGAATNLKRLEAELQIKSGETTPDQNFTIETVSCIGACGLAPVMMVNDDTHGRLSPDKIQYILSKYLSK